MLVPEYDFIKELNDNQRQAATTLDGPLLLLAGAGSGKTKTIIARSALIAAQRKAAPVEVLVMTFTNKAADEMKIRGKAMLKNLNVKASSPAVFTTFHSWGAKFLRVVNPGVLAGLGLRPDFNIVDESYKYSLISKLIPKVFDLSKNKELKKLLKVNAIDKLFTIFHTNFVPYNDVKITAKRLKVLEHDEWAAMIGALMGMGEFNLEDSSEIERLFAELFVRYKETLRANNGVDFDDLIGVPLVVLQNNPDIRLVVQQAYKYIMVDEFQDTDNVQFALVKEIVNPVTNNICVVGDDAQSIYKFRGAEVRLILNFHKHFKNTQIINLNTNYRSCKQIVEKSNLLLESSKERHAQKAELKAFKKGEGIITARYFDTFVNDEAEWVAGDIAAKIKQGVAPSDIAILYRNNMLSRALEPYLITNAVPYKLHNSMDMLSRTAAKITIAYLRLILNPKDDVLLSYLLAELGLFTSDRIYRVEAQLSSRGDKLSEYMLSGEYKGLERLQSHKKELIADFLEEWQYFAKLPHDKEEQYLRLVDLFFTSNAITTMYENELDRAEQNGKDDDYIKAKADLGLVGTLKDMAMQYKSLSEFIECLTLDNQKDDDKAERVHLMTAHRSKGLEFEIVYLFGFAQGVFPSARATTFNEVDDEERRLAYVALTRAKSELNITCSAQYYGGETKYREPSQFIFEADIPVHEMDRKDKPMPSFDPFAKKTFNPFERKGELKSYEQDRKSETTKGGIKDFDALGGSIKEI